MITFLREQNELLQQQNQWLREQMDARKAQSRTGAERTKRWRDAIAAQHVADDENATDDAENVTKCDVTVMSPKRHRDVTVTSPNVTQREGALDGPLGGSPLASPFPVTPLNPPKRASTTRGSRASPPPKVGLEESGFAVDEELVRWATTELAPPLGMTQLANATEEFSEYWLERGDTKTPDGWRRTWRNKMRWLSEGRASRGAA